MHYLCGLKRLTRYELNLLSWQIRKLLLSDVLRVFIHFGDVLTSRISNAIVLELVVDALLDHNLFITRVITILLEC